MNLLKFFPNNTKEEPSETAADKKQSWGGIGALPTLGKVKGVPQQPSAQIPAMPRVPTSSPDIQKAASQILQPGKSS